MLNIIMTSIISSEIQRFDFLCDNIVSVETSRKFIVGLRRYKLLHFSSCTGSEVGGPRLFWVMNALIYWQWGVNGAIVEILSTQLRRNFFRSRIRFRWRVTELLIYLFIPSIYQFLSAPVLIIDSRYFRVTKVDSFVVSKTVWLRGLN